MTNSTKFSGSPKANILDQKPLKKVRLPLIQSRLPVFILVLVFAFFAIASARSLVWTCDDAFISFRNADNLVQGNGLVFNPGERVESYTNPLWTVLVAGFMAAGVSALDAAAGLGIVAYLLLAVALTGWTWSRAAAETRIFLPLAAFLVLTLKDFQIWATGGLETMLFTTFATCGIMATRVRLNGPRALAAGTLLALTVLIRPDGALFALVGVISPWITESPRSRREKWRFSLVVAVPIIVLVGSHLLWKQGYYGELLPTAFYAKSAADPYFKQGLFYLGLMLLKNWFLVPMLLLTAVLHGHARSRGWRLRSADEAVFALSSFLFLAYVAYSGGDFMFARRIIPALPLLFLTFDHVVGRILPPRLGVGLTLAIIAAAFFPHEIYGPETWRLRGVADEPHFFPAAQVQARQRQGRVASLALENLPVRAMFEGGMCSFAYFSRLPYLVEMTGLTQMSLAKTPIQERGMVGHEKSPTANWLSDHRINFIFSKAYPELGPPPRGRRHDEIYFGTAVKARILLYDDSVMDALRDRPGVSFIPIERVLAQTKRVVERAAMAEANRQVAQLDRYYFQSGGPRARAAEAEFRALLARRQSEQ